MEEEERGKEEGGGRREGERGRRDEPSRASVRHNVPADRLLLVRRSARSVIDRRHDLVRHDNRDTELFLT